MSGELAKARQALSNWAFGDWSVTVVDLQKPNLSSFVCHMHHVDLALFFHKTS